MTRAEDLDFHQIMTPKEAKLYLSDTLPSVYYKLSEKVLSTLSDHRDVLSANVAYDVWIENALEEFEAGADSALSKSSDIPTDYSSFIAICESAYNEFDVKRSILAGEIITIIEELNNRVKSTNAAIHSLTSDALYQIQLTQM